LPTNKSELNKRETKLPQAFNAVAAAMIYIIVPFVDFIQQMHP
jgi:hypothetical protein